MFYRLVAAEVLPNLDWAYRKLSHHTTVARRAGDFPDLVDETRAILVDRGWDGPEDALGWLHAVYRRNRTEGQKISIYLGVE